MDVYIYFIFFSQIVDNLNILRLLCIVSNHYMRYRYNFLVIVFIGVLKTVKMQFFDT